MDGWDGLDGNLCVGLFYEHANNRCHDNFDQNIGNFDDNDDKNY